MTGKVYLVGAGPGDPDLITVKGLKCLQEADIVLYDRLANPELLRHVRKGTRIVYVGKQPDNHTITQNEINQLLIQYARKGHCVVRLKGGDPFVFGRGGEEAEECRKHGIPYEVVPGITAGLAATAYAGIPVTHREWSKSVAFITGHQANDARTEQQWASLAKGVDTICVYMGVSQLAAIVRQLARHGKPPQTPVALIWQGTLLQQQVITGTLETIEKKAREAGVANPSMIVIGEVVHLHHQLQWFEPQLSNDNFAAKAAMN